MLNKVKLLFLTGILTACPVWAQENVTAPSNNAQTENKGVITQSSVIPPAQPNVTAPAVNSVPEAVAQQIPIQALVAVQPVLNPEAVRYTLGPDDVIEINVQRHTEFSGTYPVNLEGKIQYEFVGDVDVTGLTKKEVEDKISKLISGYVVNPEVNVTILEYRSKVYYVIGEVGHPGKYFMRSDSITVREAVVEAGLPNFSAAMRKCRLITPSKNGKVKTKKVDLYTILYGGNLKRNLEMRSGDFLYVPSTIMAKVFRVIAPITEPVTTAAEAQSGVTALNTRPANTRPRAR